MADQASMNSRAAAYVSTHGAVAGPDGGVVEFANDLITLAELQADLAVLNGRETARKAVAPLGLVAFGLTVLAGGVTVCLIGAALLVATALGIHRGWAMLATAGVAMILAGLAVSLGMARLKSSFESFRPSHEELKRNLTWLRNVLVCRQHASPKRGT